jgi:phosphate-selective porin OprO/OprP
MDGLGRWARPLLAASVLSVPQVVAAQGSEANEALLQRVEELDRKVKSLEEKLEQAQRRGADAPAAVASPAPKPAEAPAPVPANAVTDPALLQRIDQIDQQVKIVGRKQEIEAEAAAARAKDTVSAYAGNQGFGIRTADNAFRLRIGALLHVDARAYLNNDFPGAAPDNFVVRRLRPVVEGTFYEKYSFLIRPEFGNQGSISLLDGYAEARFTPQFKVRAGKFKGPVGLERLQSPQDLAFIERAFPTQLVPNRDIGFQLFGDVFDGRLTYQAGYFNGVRDGQSGDSDNNSGKDFNGRLFAHPFKNGDIDALRGLGLGISVTSGVQGGSATNGNLANYVTPGQQTFFAYNAGTFASGERQRWSPQFYYYNGPLGVLGEYVTVSQELVRGSNRREITNSAWQLYATWVLTGEDAGYVRPTPRHNFDWQTGDWGAFEVGVRASELRVDDDQFAGSAATRFADPAVSARKATDLGLVLNWYLNRNIKLQFNYDQTRFKGGAANGGDLPDEKIFFSRVQAYF